MFILAGRNGDAIQYSRELEGIHQGLQIKKFGSWEYTRLLVIMSCNYRDSVRARILDGMARRAMPSSILASFREYTRDSK